MSNNARYWVMIPAAGVGTRMGDDIPKQYISINGKTIIEHTLDCFIQREEIEGIVVAISKEDEYWSTLSVSNNEKIMIAPGGDERFQSVLNGLHTLTDKAQDNDWVLVHDAARPCLKQSVIDRLIIKLRTHDIGGILALPCRDTMKRSNAAGEIFETVERENLWHAQTPQMFKLGKLLAAIEKALNNNVHVTDEAMAMELSGYKPLLVQGHPENIKVTHKEDLKYMEMYLDQGA
ncbi:MAG: 2-C-methyl-D-erythritol 4-phosphate cytidylyltransferase [Proteobacteria bacterium]|nr:2-C-methyl-D-erythritol 4-phosphate cytidylyltransferase [Pseudomonadota bacterium]